MLGEARGSFERRSLMANIAWRKSSHSNGTGANCVEAASIGPSVLVRDSKLAEIEDQSILQVDRDNWTAVLNTLR